ncbi:MAG: HU family DNA-binding protein [Candidatus Amulumruptor caecigallinarius]|nr:HU family DNA-binding protein [Candidatus Amulumruptor caecigallinarius]MCM1396021.1 HU family DNA-binding protein [Candidatus Amulumruptor caecigallinarius]
MQENPTEPNRAVKMPGLIGEAATRSGVTDSEMERVVDALRATLTGIALAGESVAIPRFGTFAAAKEEERVSRDLSTGRNVLLPPHLELRFTAAAALRHAITDR